MYNCIGERTRDAAKQLLGLLQRRKAVQPGKFGAAPRDVLVVHVIVALLDGNRDSLMLHQPQRRYWAKDTVLEDRIDARGHNLILSLFECLGVSR